MIYVAVSLRVHQATCFSVCTTRVGDSAEMTVHVISDQAEGSDVETATDGAEAVTAATVEQNGADGTETEQKSNSNPHKGSTPNGGTCAYM